MPNMSIRTTVPQDRTLPSTVRTDLWISAVGDKADRPGSVMSLVMMPARSPGTSVRSVEETGSALADAAVVKAPIRQNEIHAGKRAICLIVFFAEDRLDPTAQPAQAAGEDRAPLGCVSGVPAPLYPAELPTRFFGPRISLRNNRPDSQPLIGPITNAEICSIRSMEGARPFAASLNI